MTPELTFETCPHGQKSRRDPLFIAEEALRGQRNADRGDGGVQRRDRHADRTDPFSVFLAVVAEPDFAYGLELLKQLRTAK